MKRKDRRKIKDFAKENSYKLYVIVMPGVSVMTAETIGFVDFDAMVFEKAKIVGVVVNKEEIAKKEFADFPVLTIPAFYRIILKSCYYK